MYAYTNYMERKTFYLSKQDRKRVERLARKLKVTESEIARHFINNLSDADVINAYKYYE